MRLLGIVAFLVTAGLIGLTGYAYFGDMAADPQPMRVEIPLDQAVLSAPVPAAPGGTGGVATAETGTGATSDTTTRAAQDGAAGAVAATAGQQGANALD